MGNSAATPSGVSRTKRPFIHRRLVLIQVAFLPLLLLPLVLPAAPACAQMEYVVTIQTTQGDTTETFWLQIPRDYQPSTPCPLLIGWHQLGGNYMEFRNATVFDSIADARGWIAAAPAGSVPAHWTNHPTQSHVVDMIRWIEARYSVDANRIYMVGASMGGAAGMVFSNNHLSPHGPMVAAAASISGIQDCERRFHEQGINNSMIAAFGGTPDQVPFEYHHNSAIVFADSAVSQHRNARHLPLLLSFGRGTSDSIWRVHAEDLYACLAPFADEVVLHESILSGHGWSGAEDGLICDFLGAHTLDPNPQRISVNADQEGQWYWADIRMRAPSDSFARFEGSVDPSAARLDFAMLRNVASASLDLLPLGFPLNQGYFSCGWDVADSAGAELAFLGAAQRPAVVLRNGEEYKDWSYDPATWTLTLRGSGSGWYTVLYSAATVPSQGDQTAADASAPRHPPLITWREPGAGIGYRTETAGAINWELYNLLGRRLSSGVIEASADRSGVLSIDPGRSSGVYFVTLRMDGTVPSQLRRKVIVVH
jgi:poly(3-hydroxybutyrate) depolymerase